MGAASLGAQKGERELILNSVKDEVKARFGKMVVSGLEHLEHPANARGIGRWPTVNGDRPIHEIQAVGHWVSRIPKRDGAVCGGHRAA